MAERTKLCIGKIYLCRNFPLGLRERKSVKEDDSLAVVKDVHAPRFWLCFPKKTGLISGLPAKWRHFFFNDITSGPQQPSWMLFCILYEMSLTILNFIRMWIDTRMCACVLLCKRVSRVGYTEKPFCSISSQRHTELGYSLCCSGTESRKPFQLFVQNVTSRTANLHLHIHTRQDNIETTW